MTETRLITLDAIEVLPERLRAVRPDIVDALADSMAIQGQLHPITVRPRRGSGYTLVAGLHRLEAAKKLKQKTIRCTIFDDMDADQAELAEIDENLIRADLSPAEEAQHIGRRKELYEKLHPETKRGGAPGAGKEKENVVWKVLKMRTL